MTDLAVAFSPDGHTLATASADGTVRLWNIPAMALQGHTDRVYAVAFSPDGHTLASASFDRTIRLWNVTDPARPIPLGQPLTGHNDRVESVAFSPDGHTLASASDDQTSRLWELNADQAVRRICAVTANTLTPEEWTQVVSADPPYERPCP